jgi:lysophospholipase L1-like esterase
MVAAAAFLLVATAAYFGRADKQTRDALRLSAARNQRWLAPRIIVVGDSLAAGCPFGALSRRPLGVLNLAKGGATLKDIAGQLDRARGIAARYVIIDGGLNDILFFDATLEQIEEDFRGLLRRLGGGATAIYTLMPYVTDASYAAQIDAANRKVAALCAEHGVATLDLNPELSVDGARRPEMTDDGLHFSTRANDAWLAASRRMMA